jgi:hypothetical protein
LVCFITCQAEARAEAERIRQWFVEDFLEAMP